MWSEFCYKLLVMAVACRICWYHDVFSHSVWLVYPSSWHDNIFRNTAHHHSWIGWWFKRCKRILFLLLALQDVGSVWLLLFSPLKMNIDVLTWQCHPPLTHLGVLYWHASICNWLFLLWNHVFLRLNINFLPLLCWYHPWDRIMLCHLSTQGKLWVFRHWDTAVI
jgi:hypothetical protein